MSNPKKRASEAPPFLSWLILTFLILWIALFPAASCLQDNPKHREEREQTRPERQRGKNADEMAFIAQVQESAHRLHIFFYNWHTSVFNNWA